MTRSTPETNEKKTSKLASCQFTSSNGCNSQSVENGERKKSSSSLPYENGIVSASPKIMPAIEVPDSLFESEDDQKLDGEYTSCDNSEELSCENLKTRNNDIYKTPIPLPPPSSSAGSTYGGNQSYIRNKTLRLHESPTGSSNGHSSTWNSTGNEIISSHRQVQPGDVGLANLGNTCFMNSGLQCLIHTPPLVEYFLSLNNENAQNSNDSTLVSQFSTMMKNAWVGSSSVLSLHDFKGELGNLYNQFNNAHQHDCQEFLAVTLDALHEQLKNLKRKNDKKQVSVLNENISKCNSILPEDLQNLHKLAPEDRSSPKLCSALEQKDNNNKKHGHSVRDQYAMFDKKGTVWPFKNRSQNDSPTSSQAKLSVTRKRPVNSRTWGKDENVTVKASSKMELKESERKNTSDNDELDEKPPTKKRKEDILISDNKASELWKKYLETDDTVITSTFQGLFKSTVRCSKCDYVSVTYDPFMYLSLPIPRDVDRQLNMTFISMKDRRPQKVQLQINMEYNVAALKRETVKKVFLQDNFESDKYSVALVSNHYVHQILEDDTVIKNMHEKGRNIYVIELNANFDDNPPYSCSMINLTHNHVPDTTEVVSSSELNPNTYLEEDWESPVNAPLPPLIETTSANEITSTTESISGGVTMSDDKCEKSEELLMCQICLEDIKASEIKQHQDCNCYLCKDCLSKSVQHFESNQEQEMKTENFLKCAVCCLTVSIKDFVPVGSNSVPRLIFLLSIPILFRNDADADTNSKISSNLTPQLFGYPWIIRVPSYVNASELHMYLSSINPFPQCATKFCIASNDGQSCNKCQRDCTGCAIPKFGMISLAQKSISIVMSYNNLSLELTSEIQPNDMSSVLEPVCVGWPHYRQEEPMIDIHDSLEAFSQIEHLDAQNPWYCPMCKGNESATKAITIGRLPDFLIVYLKRFVFLDHSSNKLNNRLKFPVTDLDVRNYVSDDCEGKEYTYDLYSIVCHYGGASSGHYTAFGKNPTTKNWNLFNDSSISSQDPNEQEYASAYILFYQRRGTTHNIEQVLQNSVSLDDRKIFDVPLRGRAGAKATPSHYSGGNYQENKQAITGNRKIDRNCEESISSQNSLDDLSLSMTTAIKESQFPDDVTACSQSIPNLKNCLEEENGSNVSNSSDWEVEENGVNSREIPTLKNETSVCLQRSSSPNSSMETDNQENSTPKARDMTSSKPNGGKMQSFHSRTNCKNVKHPQ